MCDLVEKLMLSTVTGASESGWASAPPVASQWLRGLAWPISLGGVGNHSVLAITEVPAVLFLVLGAPTPQPVLIGGAQVLLPAPSPPAHHLSRDCQLSGDVPVLSRGAHAPPMHHHCMLWHIHLCCCCYCIDNIMLSVCLYIFGHNWGMHN